MYLAVRLKFFPSDPPIKILYAFLVFSNTGCPTRYRTRRFFNNSNTNEDIATKFEQEYVRCVRNEEKCVCSVSVV